MLYHLQHDKIANFTRSETPSCTAVHRAPLDRWVYLLGLALMVCKHRSPANVRILPGHSGFAMPLGYVRGFEL